MSEKMAKGGKNSKDNDNGDGGLEEEDKAEEMVMKAKSKKGKKSKASWPAGKTSQLAPPLVRHILGSLRKGKCNKNLL